MKKSLLTDLLVLHKCVEVKLELGHKATVRSKPTAEGFTHDWTVFVRGPEGSNIQHFVEKVHFYLHESFPRPKRVVKEPPYQVAESGYAGFLLPIEVFFKNKEEPKKVYFEYDLFLHVEGPPVNSIRCEKLTFQNPTEDFRRKLIKAGGVGVLGPDGGTVLGQQADGGGENHGMVIGPPKHPRPSPEPIKKPRPISSSKESSQQQRPTSAPQQSMTATEPFVALFGQPIKTNKVSPDSRKTKDGSGKTSGKGSSGPGRPPSSGAAMTARKEPKSTTKEAKHKESSKESVISDDSSHKETKGSMVKRPTTVTMQTVDDNGDAKKRKRLSQTAVLNTSKGTEKLATSKKKKRDGDEKKDKTKPEKVRSEKKSSGSSSRSIEASTGSSKNSTGLSQSSIVREMAMMSDIPVTKAEPETEPSPPDTSPESSISFSSLHISGKRGPLGTLMAELDDDEDDELVSPLSSDPPSPPRFSAQPTTPTIVKPQPIPPTEMTPPKPEITKSKPEKHHKIRHKKMAVVESKVMEDDVPVAVPVEPVMRVPSRERSDEACDLVALHKYLNAMQDRDLLQTIADIIEETGRYNITASTLDFDLHALDKATIRKLQGLLPVS